MSLSSLIVQREVASIRQVEEALARQVLYGGDLVTNLLEVVQLPEAVLVPLLAESVGMIAAPIGMLPPPSHQARVLVPEDVAARRRVMPLSVDGGSLVLAVSEPLDREVLEELSFALGVLIEERIAPSVRICEALARVYGVPLERRMARLVGRLAGVDSTVPNSLPPVLTAKASVPPLPGALSHDLPKLNPPGMPAMGSMRFSDSSARPDERKVDPPRASPPPEARPSLPRILREPKASQELGRRRGPITLDRVTDELMEITDREALLQLFFDFSRQFFEYSAIFVVHGDLAEGRDAFGSGAPRDRVLALGVPLDMPSVLRTVKDRGVAMCAYTEEGGLDAVMMTDLRRTVGSQVLVVPIVVRSRVVGFFVADDGAAGIDPTAQGEVTTVAALVGREFERLIVRTKLQGFTGEAPVRERRVDPRRVEPKNRRRDPKAREAAVQALGEAVAPAPQSVRPAAPTPPSVRPAAPTPPSVRAAAPTPPSVRPPPHVDDLPAPAAVQPSERPGALRPAPQTSDRPGAFRPAPQSSEGPAPIQPAPILPLPSSSQTLRNFLGPVLPESTAKLDAAAPARSFDSFDPPPPFDGADGVEQARELAGELSDLPPPPQVLAVRRASGAPIPREEDEGEGPVSSTRFIAPERISSRPPPADLRQARLLRELDALTAQFVHSPAPPPTRAQAVSLPPRHPPPPSSRTPAALPSIIVDVSAQTDQLAEAFVANPNDEQAEADLLRLGQQAMPSIMKHFPGPLTITRETLDDSWPRVTECGPVLRLIAGQRRVALPFVLARTEDADTENRFWATYLLTELAYADAIPATVARLFDDSKRVRRAARLVAHVLGASCGPALVLELDRIVRDPKATSARRVVTLDALGEMRDPIVVPVLLGALGDTDEDVALAARRGMILVSRQDFGRDTRKWFSWWNASSSRHRIEWLIDALTHELPAMRRAAGQELKALTEEYFGYYDDQPKKERERAQQQYRDWWKTQGLARFRGA